MLSIDDVKDPRLQQELKTAASNLASEFIKELNLLDSLNLMTTSEQKWVIYLLRNMIEERVRKKANTKFL